MFFNAGARNRPLRAPTTHGEVGRPSERECREYAEFCSRVEQVETFVQGPHPEPSITYSGSSIEWSASFFLFCL